MVVAAPSMAVTVPSLAPGHLACTTSSSATSTSRVRAPALRSGSGVICRIGTTSSVRSGFGNVSELTAVVQIHAVGGGSRSSVVTMEVKPVIQFIRGVDERVVPDVKLTRSRDGTNGVAIFNFDQPSVFDSSKELGDITGLYMLDEEGTLSTVDVSAKFLNGKPARIEGQYIMRSKKEWDRFMRFMERYAKENQLGFVKS